jgi:hypothetical protein
VSKQKPCKSVSGFVVVYFQSPGRFLDSAQNNGEGTGVYYIILCELGALCGPENLLFMIQSAMLGTGLLFTILLC